MGKKLSRTATSTYGYHGRYLFVDLDADSQRKSLDGETQQKFLGGSGLGTYLVLKHNAAEVGALDRRSSIAFAFSPLVGSPLTTSAKFAVVSKGVLTDRINDSLASSGFAIAGKSCGVDAIVISGKAPEPSILVIDGDEVRLEPAGETWGREITATQDLLRERFGKGYQFAVIGPAGEQLVRFATISHDGRHAGRGGSGAVLGSKLIKAIAVRGSHRVDWANPEKLISFSKQLSAKSFGPATAKYRELGTASNLLLFNRLKALPTRNFQSGSFEFAENISPESMSQVREKTRDYCAACTIGCEHIYQFEEQGGVNASESTQGVRLEYENLFSLGSLCGIGDSQVVLQACKRCDELGIDTISAGGTIAFVMECAERGILPDADMRFGNGQGLLKAIEDIAARRGFGDQMAEGSRRLALELGGNSIAFAPQVKGLEIPGYEPRTLQTMALGFAVGTRGADHNRSGAYEADFSGDVDRRSATISSVPMAIETEDRAALIDSLILCKFVRGVFDDLFAESAEMLRLVTGWDIDGDELRRTARRIVTAKKVFNVKAGWHPKEDVLPERFLTQPLEDDPARLTSEQMQKLVAAYNSQRGYSQDGFPMTETLRDLGLE